MDEKWQLAGMTRPQPGQRVVTMLRKEMIFSPTEENQDLWIDPGMCPGDGIVAWCSKDGEIIDITREGQQPAEE